MELCGSHGVSKKDIFHFLGRRPTKSLTDDQITQVKRLDQFQDLCPSHFLERRPKKSSIYIERSGRPNLPDDGASSEVPSVRLLFMRYLTAFYFGTAVLLTPDTFEPIAGLLTLAK